MVFKNLNKGLFLEFILFVLLQGFDLFTNVWVATQAQDMLVNLEQYEHIYNTTGRNYSVPEFCTGQRWSIEKTKREFNRYREVLMAFYVFMFIAVIIYTLNFILWTFIIWSSLEDLKFLTEKRRKLVTGKICFLIAATVLEDVPFSTLAAVIFSIQHGNNGLVCWFCKESGICLSNRMLEKLLSRSSKNLIINVAAVSLTTLWKGVSSFFRWSKMKHFDCFVIRAMSSVFAGGLYLCVVLTPAFTVLKYDYYARPGMKGELLKDFIDKLYIVGVMLWVMCFCVACCCPLLKLIRLAQ